MKYRRKNKAKAIIQILILILGIFAISWMIGGEIKEVSADTTCSSLGGICEDQNLCYGTGDEIKYPSTSCESGVCCKEASSTTTTNSCSTKKFCSGMGVYGGKLDVGGNCVADYNKGLLEKCNYGCKLGACQDKSDSYGGAKELGMLVASTYISAKVAAAVAPAAAVVPSAPVVFTSHALLSTTVSGGTPGTLGGFLFGTTTTTITSGEVAGTAPIVATTWTGVGGASAWGAAGAIAIWAAVAFLVGRYIGPMLGLSTHNSQVAGWALAVGTIAGLALTSAALAGKGAEVGLVAGGPIMGVVIGLGVAVIIFLLFGRKTSGDLIQYTCSQWDSQNGRSLTEDQKIERCKMCNNQKDLVCTEYQCRSLGQGCVLINEESSGKQLCIWDNVKDVLPPVIKPWEDALLDDFKYTPDNAISPPDRGVKISYTGPEDVTSNGAMRCAPPYTRVSFGVQLDEAAKCKINPLKLNNYSSMADVFMGRGIRDYNHSFVLSLPSQEALESENITINNGGRYELYVRCEDSNGNSNIGNFVFKFCISQGPDTTPPLIIGANILNNQPIAYGQKSINMELYVNEPSECKWSYLDKDYDVMEGNMTCNILATEMNAQMLYTCKGNLTGLKDNQNNKFYFRCKDQPSLKGTPKESERNANTQSYPLNLIGTRPLVIEKVGPAGIIEDSTNVIKINLTAQTAAGYDEGKAICSFSETGNSGSYVNFFYGNDIEPFSQYQHMQELWLSSGEYTYYIRCRDMGGNIDDKNVSFRVEIDNSPPTVVRVYKEDENLKIITDEPGTCVYSTFGRNYLFVDGTEMSSISEKEFYTEWNTAINFYIKCEDEYGNQPLPNECSIIARPFEIAPLQ